MEPITFTASVYKVQTLADCGIRVTLDLAETAIMQMAELAEVKRAGVALEFTAEPVKQVITSGKTRDMEEGGKRKSKWQTSEESSTQ